MSFGDGNLRERVGDLNRQVDKLQRVNGELCAEINRQERRIRELEGRTCEPTDCDSGEMDVDVYALSCGHVAYYPSVYEDTPSYCPECGAKVVER